MSQLPGGTVTFVFTDIEGSTRLLQELGDEAFGRVSGDHRRLVREAFAEHDGTEIDTQGDAFFFSFPRARDAVAAAVDAQRALDEHEWPGGREVRVRMGLHTGEAALADDRYLGLAVHHAARIGAAAQGGQVLLSDLTRGLVEHELPAGVALRDLGELSLKDIDRPVHIYQLDVAGLQTEFPLSPALVAATPVPCPYVGMRAFQEEDAAFFFGREELVADLLARLAKASPSTTSGNST